MRTIIGFAADNNEKENEQSLAQTAVTETEEPFRCLVKIRFSGIEKEYSYYNDEFYLEEGDHVFVSGRLYGKTGVVTDVNRHFRINLKDYQKVIAKINLNITGRFIPVCDKMVSFNTNVTAEAFEKTIIAPPDPDDTEEAGEIVSGEGWTVDLEDFENCPDIKQITLQRAVDYCIEGKVAFLSLKDGKGTAFVMGSSWYKVEFDFDGETVSNLFCDCPYPDFSICKHETAVLLTLRMLLSQPEFDDKNNFTAFEKDFFTERFLSQKSEIIFN